MAQWNKNTVPKCKDRNCSDEVLATVIRYGFQGEPYRKVIRAIYVPYHHCTTDDIVWCAMDDKIPDDWEHMEEEDSYWIPEGWYEISDYFEDYSCVPIPDRVIAWMKLPKPYEESIKKFE